jgi:hypothetical protein
MVERVTQEEFLRRAQEAHGDRYGYDKARYVAGKRPVTITCPDHGEFRQMPLSHWKGHGCPRCGAQRVGDARRRQGMQRSTSSGS